MWADAGRTLFWKNILEEISHRKTSDKANISVRNVDSEKCFALKNEGGWRDQ